jgi:hypothetical protein
MREAAILIILYTEITKNSKYRVHFYSVNRGENERGKICD